MKKIIIVLVTIPVIFWAVWFIFPETSIQSVVDNSLSNNKFRLEVIGLNKGLFYKLNVDNLILKSSEEELITLNNIKSRINPLYLFIFQIRGYFNGEISGGYFSGNINFSKENIQSKIDFKQANISNIQLFKLFGIRGSGTISGSIIIKDNSGYIEFVTKDAAFEPFSFSNFRVPLNFFQNVMGSIEIKEEMINIISLTLDGKDIYARLKGIIQDNAADLKMELMPGKSFLENPFFLSEFERYRMSPGYYVIPLRGEFMI